MMDISNISIEILSFKILLSVFQRMSEKQEQSYVKQDCKGNNLQFKSSEKKQERSLKYIQINYDSLSSFIANMPTSFPIV